MHTNVSDDSDEFYRFSKLLRLINLFNLNMVESNELSPKDWMSLDEEEKSQVLQKLSNIYKENGLQTAKLEVL